MKYPKLTGLLFVLLSVSIARAQNNGGAKPSLFASFPNTINCTEQELGKAFAAGVNQTISFSFSDHFLFSGIVTGSVVKYSNLHSVTITSPAMDNVIFAISRIINADRSITYVGHIINKNYADGYELKKDASNNYQLVKFETDKVLQDCHQQ
jgi:hypothetical protein